jgi:hypothetical protein
MFCDECAYVHTFVAMPIHMHICTYPFVLEGESKLIIFCREDRECTIYGVCACIHTFMYICIHAHNPCVLERESKLIMCRTRTVK